MKTSFKIIMSSFNRLGAIVISFRDKQAETTRVIILTQNVLLNFLEKSNNDNFRIDALH